jgi:hypothetical protein
MILIIATKQRIPPIFIHPAIRGKSHTLIAMTIVSVIVRIIVAETFVAVTVLAVLLRVVILKALVAIAVVPMVIKPQALVAVASGGVLVKIILIVRVNLVSGVFNPLIFPFILTIVPLPRMKRAGNQKTEGQKQPFGPVDHLFGFICVHRQ